MRRLWRPTLGAIVIGTAALVVVVGQAAATTSYGPYASKQIPSTGTCGNVWARMNLSRRYVDDPTRRHIREVLHPANFKSLAGASPGACQAGTDNGNRIIAGLHGAVAGHLDLYVTNGTFNPSATCDTATCDEADFVASFYGPNATFTIHNEVIHFRTSNPLACLIAYWTPPQAMWVDYGGSAAGDMTTTC